MVIWNVSDPVRSVMIIGMGVVVAAAAGALIIFIGEVGADLLGIVLQVMRFGFAFTNVCAFSITAVTAYSVFPVFLHMVDSVSRSSVPTICFICINTMAAVADVFCKTHQGQGNTNDQQTDSNKPFHE